MEKNNDEDCSGNILVMRFSAMGDIAMTIPVVFKYAEQHPEQRVIYLSRDTLAPLFKHVSQNIEFIGIDLQHGWRGFMQLFRIAWRLRSRNITQIADLHDVIRTKILRRLVSAFRKCRVARLDKLRAERRTLCEHRTATMSPITPTIQRYADVFRELGDATFEVPEHFRLRFDKIDLPLERTSRQEEPRIGLAPFAAHHGKILPIARTEKFVQRFFTRYPLGSIYVFGSQKEMLHLRESWNFGQLTFVCDIASNLAQEMSVIQELDVMVSMDSANMHLASLVGVPVVSIWGATHPYAGFLGYEQSAENAVQIPLPCRPCSIYGKKKCIFSDYACLNLIQPEHILEKVEKIVEEQ
ncbi:MAG: glycosyltransferase family 9 protein [Bacteroidaceae bacterium]|nr:glycosyltransferase family 9 protein [Bacteroidaceae bacterium]